MSFCIKYFLSAVIALSAVQLFGNDAVFDLVGVEKRVTDLESRVEAIEKKLATCRCPDGPCVCEAGSCPCPDCPKHGDKLADKPATENAFTGEGREVVVLGTSWCKQCPAAKQAAVANGIPYFDAEKDSKGIGLAKKYNVNSYPRIMVFKDGVLSKHITGADWPSAIRREANEFDPQPIKKTSSKYAYSQAGYNAVAKCTVSRLNSQRWTWPGNLGQHLLSEHGFNPAGFSHRELVTIHDNFHNTGRSGVSGRGRAPSTTPTYYRAPQYYRPVRQYQPRVYFQQSYCPSCAR